MALSGSLGPCQDQTLNDVYLRSIPQGQLTHPDYFHGHPDDMLRDAAAHLGATVYAIEEALATFVRPRLQTAPTTSRLSASTATTLEF